MTTTTTNWETVRHEGEVYKVLNDHAGTLTVTEWREQLEEYAEHICDKTGLELLKGPKMGERCSSISHDESRMQSIRKREKSQSDSTRQLARQLQIEQQSNDDWYSATCLLR